MDYIVILTPLVSFVNDLSNVFTGVLMRAYCRPHQEVLSKFASATIQQLVHVLYVVMTDAFNDNHGLYYLAIHVSSEVPIRM